MDSVRNDNLDCSKLTVRQDEKVNLRRGVAQRVQLVFTRKSELLVNVSERGNSLKVSPSFLRSKTSNEVSKRWSEAKYDAAQSRIILLLLPRTSSLQDFLRRVRNGITKLDVGGSRVNGIGGVTNSDPPERLRLKESLHGRRP